jgi:hypothetical protein
LAHHFGIFKFIRRKSALCAKGMLLPDDPVLVWPSIREEWRHWLTELETNPWTHHPPSHGHADTLVLVTDASTIGWGAVLINDTESTIYEAAGRWKSHVLPSEITKFEIEAVDRAVTALKCHMTSAGSLLILVDNTGCKGALAKGSSASRVINDAVRRALDTLSGNMEVRIAYIATSENPADEPSRGKPLNEEKLASL